MATTYRINWLPRYSVIARYASRLVGVIKTTAHRLWKSSKLAAMTAFTLCHPIRYYVLRRWRYWRLEPDQQPMPCGHSLCQPSHAAKTQAKERYPGHIVAGSTSSSNIGSTVELCFYSNSQHLPHRWNIERSESRPSVLLWVRDPRAYGPHIRAPQTGTETATISMQDESSIVCSVQDAVLEPTPQSILAQQ